jgi:hypothetical protein
LPGKDGELALVAGGIGQLLRVESSDGTILLISVAPDVTKNATLPSLLPISLSCLDACRRLSQRVEGCSETPQSPEAMSLVLNALNIGAQPCAKIPRLSCST